MSGQKFVRENTAMRYFFSLCPFKRVNYFKVGPQEQYSFLFYRYPHAPSPTLGLSGPSLLFLMPTSYRSDKRPLGSSLFKVDCHHVAKDLFCLLFCFQPTLEQRSQDQLTNRYKAKRQRQ